MMQSQHHPIYKMVRFVSKKHRLKCVIIRRTVLVLLFFFFVNSGAKFDFINVATFLEVNQIYVNHS